jgi:Holliday junction resolvase RusA-like endonuclease
MTEPSVVIEIPGNPRTKENNYMTTKRSKNIYIPSDLVRWEEEAHLIAVEAMKADGWPGPWAGRVTVAADFRFNTWHEKDITNFWKSILDALSGAVYDDDAQIDRTFQCRQKSSNNPGITLYVWFHDFDLNEIGRRRPREWHEFTCLDFDLPDVHPVVTTPDACHNKTRFASFGDGRKKSERAAKAATKRRNTSAKRKPATARKARPSRKKGPVRRP